MNSAGSTLTLGCRSYWASTCRSPNLHLVSVGVVVVQVELDVDAAVLVLNHVTTTILASDDGPAIRLVDIRHCGCSCWPLVQEGV